jgi:hypothetical protein
MEAQNMNAIAQQVIKASRQCRYLNPTQTGVYLGQEHERIVATLRTIQHFRAFLASDSSIMHDPYSGWMRDELDKLAAQRKLSWLVNVAINRKAGIPDTKWNAELWRFSRSVNTPRLRVYERDCPAKYRTRLAHRLVKPGEDW